MHQAVANYLTLSCTDVWLFNISGAGLIYL